MKKFFLSYIILLCSAFCYSQDACYTIYMEALHEYNNGNYTEAQRKFVIVAQNCGDYSEVWNMLKSCNSKIAERQKHQAAQIVSLRQENSQLVKETENCKTNVVAIKNELSEHKGYVIGQKNVIKQYDDSIKSLNYQLQQRQYSIVILNNTLDSLTTLLDTANVQIQILQAEKANSNKKKDKKRFVQQEITNIVVPDTLPISTQETKQIPL